MRKSLLIVIIAICFISGCSINKGNTTKTESGLDVPIVEVKNEEDKIEIARIVFEEYLKLTYENYLNDKNERVNVLSPVPLYVFIFLVPALLMIRFGILGWVLGALTVYSVRNINTDTSKTILMKSLMSILAIVISYIILIALIFALNIFVSK